MEVVGATFKLTCFKVTPKSFFSLQTSSPWGFMSGTTTQSSHFLFCDFSTYSRHFFLHSFHFNSFLLINYSANMIQRFYSLGWGDNRPFTLYWHLNTLWALQESVFHDVFFFFFACLPTPFFCACVCFVASAEQLLTIARAGINNDLLNRSELNWIETHFGESDLMLPKINRNFNVWVDS